MRTAVALGLVAALGVGVPARATEPAPHWIPSPAPTPGFWPALLAPDAGHDRLVLLGGYGSGYGVLGAGSPGYVPHGSTWTFDGTSWTRQQPATSPPFRTDGAMAHDGARDEVVLFGGSSYPNGLADTWTWDGTTWTEESPPVSPPPRSGAAMAYDAARGVVLLFGGWLPSARRYANDLWAWDGTTWTELPTPPLAPAPRERAAMAYAGGRLVLFGGYDGSPLGDTWYWDGAAWSFRDGQPDLAPRAAAALAADPATGTVVLFGGDGGGGTEYGDTWVERGGRWERVLTPAQPDPRYGAGFAYFPALGRFVLATGHGTPYTLGIHPGVGQLPDTWFFDHLEG